MQINRWDKFFFGYFLLGCAICIPGYLPFVWWLIGLALATVVKIFRP